MIDFAYTAQQIKGVWRLLFKGDSADLDRSLDGVFHSFWAIALSTPFILATYMGAQKLAAMAPDSAETIFTKAPFLWLFGARLLAFLAYWAASIAFLSSIARMGRASGQAGTMMIAYNWSHFLSFAAASAPAAALALTGNAELFAVFALPAVIFSYVVFWNTLRRTLPLTIGVTIAIIAGLTVFQILVNAIISESAIGLYQLVS